MESRIDITPLGDRAIVLYFKQKIDAEVSDRVLAVSEVLANHPFPNQEALIPAYASITLLFSESLSLSHLKKIQKALSKVWTQVLTTQYRSLQERAQASTRIFEVPVRYGGAQGPDLSEVAKIHRITEAEVIQLHTEPVYRVYQIGFNPGFPYLGGLRTALHTPRLETPRPRVPAGSVGIGGQQTGIYSVEGPGGWRIIGKTDIPLFEVDRVPPSLLRPGMRLKFVEESP